MKSGRRLLEWVAQDRLIAQTFSALYSQILLAVASMEKKMVAQ
jgi:hypothetical protein